ncbi:unnamed protein product [Pleuronectes platessa]|uniref:Uncharacterized protein n=1 Tax=Pleuronectes platessa TaxID=8262 RepID=A0A9N7UYY8_PLEPL|nr:unnamed protein product [Pleuronectes platessa]
MRVPATLEKSLRTATETRARRVTRARSVQFGSVRFSSGKNGSALTVEAAAGSRGLLAGSLPWCLVALHMATNSEAPTKVQPRYDARLRRSADFDPVLRAPRGATPPHSCPGRARAGQKLLRKCKEGKVLGTDAKKLNEEETEFHRSDAHRTRKRRGEERNEFCLNANTSQLLHAPKSNTHPQNRATTHAHTHTHTDEPVREPHAQKAAMEKLKRNLRFTLLGLGCLRRDIVARRMMMMMVEEGAMMRKLLSHIPARPPSPDTDPSSPCILLAPPPPPIILCWSDELSGNSPHHTPPPLPPPPIIPCRRLQLNRKTPSLPPSLSL